MKPARDEFTREKIREWENEDPFNKSPHPTK
jgi:hypothetical protein